MLLSFLMCLMLSLQQAGTSAVAGTLMASATNIISMGVGVYLMEKTGRRSLLLSGTFGMSMSALLIVLAMVLNVSGIELS